MENRKSLKRVLSFIRPYISRIVLALLCMLAVAGLSLLIPWLVKDMIDKVLMEKDLKMLNLICILGIGIYFFKGLFSFGQEYLMAYVAQKLVFDLRNRLWKHLSHLSLSFFTRERGGNIISRLTNDIALIEQTLTYAVVDFVIRAVTVIGIIAFIFYINWELSLISVSLLPLTAFLIEKYSKKMRKLGRQIQDSLSSLTSIASEVIGAIKVVKAFATSDKEVERFEEANVRSLRASLKGAKLRAMLSPTVELVAAASTIFLLWYGGRKVIEGKLTPGELVAFLGYVAMIVTPLKGLSAVFGRLQQALAAADRIFEFMEIPIEVPQHEDAIDMPEIRGEVEFRGVSFSYGDELILRDINLKVKPGEVIGVVGPSGSGKTTLVDLIPRFYDPTEGVVLIDSIDIRKVKLDSLRRQIGIVSQDTVLFATTVRENIAYGKPNATFEEIVQAAKIANAHDFIMKLPNGYDTIVGERGVTLSGGERQRIAIARAILGNPRILVFDEATSALDSESEKLVQEALERVMKGRTTFFVAHRLSTLRCADRIIVLNDGRIVEEGSHEELLKKRGLYWRLYVLQGGNGEV
ncbi:MAG: ABC transporter ATP-binding protein/permease [Synergistetes bacterium]|nr:ABC transporter ATP-binding protein/permease [Synergistota bacterium]MDW8193111.1 ABC transporter ATP-binding protein [Synergistota bacterium]